MGFVNSLKKAVKQSVKTATQNKPNSKLAPQSSSKVGEKYKEEIIDIVGEDYCLKNIMKLGQKNSDYSDSAQVNIENDLAMKKIFQYNFINKPVSLVPEPTNKHDKNAIMVCIANKKVGYIPADLTAHIRRIFSGDVKFISAFVSGGKYKVVSTNGDVDEGEYRINIRVRIGYKG